MHRVATTLLTAATVLLHTVIGCSACRLCERYASESPSVAVTQAISECHGCRAGVHRECDSLHSQVVVSSAIVTVDTFAANGLHCECGGPGAEPLSHPCGHGTCSLRITKYLSLSGSTIPDAPVIWLAIDDLQKPIVEELRAYPIRRLRYRPQQLRTHLSLRVLLI